VGCNDVTGLVGGASPNGTANCASAKRIAVNRDRTSYRWSRRKIRWGGNPACQVISVTQRTDMLQICGSASDLIKPRAMLAAVKTASRRVHGGLRPVLTAAARGAAPPSGRDGETALQPNRETETGVAPIEQPRPAMWLGDHAADQTASVSVAGRKPDQAVYPLHYAKRGRASDRVGVERHSGFCFWGHAG
jgi:hypothetical protein